MDLLPVSFMVEPPEVEIAIDGKTMAGGPTFPLKTGKHNIAITKKNFKTVEDTVDVNPNRVLFIYNLEFKPEMVLIPGGTFEMGDVFGEGEPDEKPVHRVAVNSFFMSQYEVTFSEFDAFCEAMGREKPGDNGWNQGLRPAIFVSWYDAVEYCNWRSEQEGLKPCYKIDKTRKELNNTNTYDDIQWPVECDFSASGYRLPTEAEWEYAAREGGKKVRFGNGKDSADPNEINFNGSEGFKESYSVEGVVRNKTVPVGSFFPNRFGLYDMSGNVWEWCWDWSGDYSSGAQTDPTGPSSGQYRVLRGGSLYNSPADVRATDRYCSHPNLRNSDIGFRLAKTFPPKAGR